MKPTLFVLRDLPRPSISIQGVIEGDEALSGTHTSALLVAEGLTRRGHPTGLVVLNRARVTETALERFDTLEYAASWVRSGQVIWVYYGDDPILDQLNAVGIVPLLWVEIDVPRVVRTWLGAGRISGVLTVSDTSRLPILRSRAHRRIGRVYNPLAPAFEFPVEPKADRYDSRVVVFTGYFNTSKGAHRLMQLWPYVRRIEPAARLVVAGSERLYGNRREVGSNGVATAAFEQRYLMPIMNEFGSLEKAGIHLAGLMTPAALRNLYSGCSLGVVNLNLEEFTETFCCAAVEMLATKLPVFSVARGALPETIGSSGGAWLTRHADLEESAQELAGLLRDGDRLRQLGERGAEFVLREYGTARIVDTWERMLGAVGDLESLSGSWRGPRTKRYWAERWAGRLRLESIVDTAARVMSAIVPDAS